ncbi:isochorismatase family protein [Chitinophaga oryzae]|uniref:Isochorismatase family protein n=1 Tax=Chitinophaga oryzae TaxID=2725414 RepID=A0AAE7D7C5_9BACT|nr:isochorismatase family protein [Chitinophaga oryzae]QJB32610.1 isochorismatase family protein [Chitinophaga oryzae]QJB39062.1 isochorismatase family protein [Chitinophaga oryzae]
MITSIDKNTALVLIDLQKGIYSRQTAHPVQDVLHNAARLATAFREAGLPVVVVHVNPIGSPAMTVRAEVNNGVPKEPAAQQQQLEIMKAGGFFDIAPDINVQPEDILITKGTFSAFPHTPLLGILRDRHITNIVLAGISTSIGVEGTARSANEHGFNITFATDAMTDTQPACHENSVRYIFPRIGETGTTEAVLHHLHLREK